MLQHQEAQQGRDREISKVTARVQTLMRQAKGKGKASDPTPVASGAGGGNPPPPPRKGPQVLWEEEESVMMREQDLGRSQMKAAKEDGTRDPRPTQKITITPGTTNSSTSCPESWPTPWDVERESQQNPLPCSKTQNTNIYTCGY